MKKIETVINESKQPVVKYVIESPGDDQALHHIACRPSEPFLEMVLKESGFKYIYMPKVWPMHPQFARVKKVKNNLEPYSNLTRTIIIASYGPLQNKFLAPIDKKLFIKRMGIFEYLIRASYQRCKNLLNRG